MIQRTPGYQLALGMAHGYLDLCKYQGQDVINTKPNGEALLALSRALIAADAEITRLESAPARYEAMLRGKL